MRDQARVEVFRIEDYEEVRELWVRSPGVCLDDDGSDSREGIARYLARNPEMSFVARSGDRIVGACLSGHDGRRGKLQHMAVDAAFHRRGVGRRLVEACLEALRNAGIEKCHLFVSDDNSGGRAFWERLGWVRHSGFTMMRRSTDDREETPTTGKAGVRLEAVQTCVDE